MQSITIIGPFSPFSPDNGSRLGYVIGQPSDDAVSPVKMDVEWICSPYEEDQYVSSWRLIVVIMEGIKRNIRIEANKELLNMSIRSSHWETFWSQLCQILRYGTNWETMSVMCYDRVWRRQRHIHCIAWVHKRRSLIFFMYLIYITQNHTFYPLPWRRHFEPLHPSKAEDVDPSASNSIRDGEG